MNIFRLLISAMLLTGCDTESIPTAHLQTETSSAPEKFVTIDYIDLSKIERISTFRSGIGHNYSDAAESCRSMKHYYQPKGNIDWSTVTIFSPVSGTIIRRDEEWAGTQLWIRPFSHPGYTFIIFHIALLMPLAVNDTVTAGRQLGTHIGPQTMSDIAIGFSPKNIWTLVSYFDVMSDSLFLRYQERGVPSRGVLIITKEARDADPLRCTGETFGTSGMINNWVDLN
ncbi:MAG: hypothetical protein WCX28_00110 [Bacteriovoracaceae bacterium]|nr:hypothetical protein [Bacteroidota bacterium]